MMSLIKRNSCRLASEILPAAVKISARRMSSLVVRFTSVAKAWRCLTAAWSNCLVRASGVWAKDRRVAWVISAAVVLGVTDDIAKARIRAYGVWAWVRLCAGWVARVAVVVRLTNYCTVKSLG